MKIKKLVKQTVDFTIVKFLKYLNQATYFDYPEPNNVYKILYSRAQIRSADYIEPLLNRTYLFLTKEALWDHAIKSVSDTGIICEFGVLSGYSINYIASKLPVNAEIYGFDSFIGIEDNWYGVAPAGAMNLNGVMPKVHPNITLIPGFFNQTLPIFFAEKATEKISLAHLDADTFEATTTALYAMKSKLFAGSVLIFDEYHGHPNWENGEFKAFKIFVAKENIEYSYLGFSLQQAAVIITKI
jgi:predicted O-methyltransferase YrrM